MFLDKEIFSAVIASTPLVSIDLVIINHLDQALLGKRLNKPAKDFWFVPGGRIFKDESLAEAFKRLTLEELGAEFNIEEASLLGPYDHFYNDNVFGDEFGTHYIAIAYVIKLNKELTCLPVNIQHAQYKWFNIEDLLVSTSVHTHSKLYFHQKYSSILSKD
jgi:colanic acid biosynthesis protein WcaH